MFSTMIGNPYESCGDREVVCITTNGEIKKDQLAVMGAGTAKFARENFPGIDLKLANYLKAYGNRVFNLGTQQYKDKNVILVSFPTKHEWKKKSDLALIKKSASELKALCDKFKLTKIYLPSPGGQNGRLKWSQVKPMLEDLDDRFVVYSSDPRAFEK